MAPPFVSRLIPSRRVAEEFDAAVQGLVEGRPPSETAAGERTPYAGLLTVVGALQAVPAPRMREEFAAELRVRLLAEAETVLAPLAGTSAEEERLRLPVRGRTRDRVVAAVAGGLVLAGATGSVAVAAQSALPGDALYPLKRVIEDTSTGLTFDDAARGRGLLQDAATRLEEVEALSGSRSDAARPASLGAVDDTLTTFSVQAQQASDLLLSDYAETSDDADVVELRTFAATSMVRLEDLEPLVPADARDELVAAATTLRHLDGQALRVCPTCGEDAIVALPVRLAAATSAPDSLTATPIGTPLVDRPGSGTPGGAGPDALPDLPEVDPGDLPPGSVSDPGSGSDPGSDSGSGSDDDGPVSATDALTDVTDDLTDAATGGTASVPAVPKVLGGVSDTVDDVTDELDDVLDPITDPITGSVLPGSP